MGEMPRFFINTYKPLAINRAGRAASEIHRLPPFIDGSIRREPDLEHELPSISCLCRAGKFAPRLRVGDIVAYLTTKHSFGRGTVDRRITAVLRVIRVFADHEAAAQWFRSEGK